MSTRSDHGYHASHIARVTPEKSAIIMAGSGERLTYGELEARSNQIAHILRGAGLNPGDTIAILVENSPCFFELVLAAQRSGLYYVCLPTKLTPSEIAYILEDSGAHCLLTSQCFIETARQACAEANLFHRYIVAGQADGFQSLEQLMLDAPKAPIADECAGMDMLYSSGTTGRPKGIKPPFKPNLPIDADNLLRRLMHERAGIDEASIYLSPAPLYHAAPLRWCLTALSIGVSVIVMEAFKPDAFLEAVEAYRVTHTQLVPTMFAKMLKLPEETRMAYDVSSLEFAIHAAAPCPASIKERMMEWWGPIISEYYAGSESNGLTWINATDWLAHKGSVGKPVIGSVHICDEAGAALPSNQIGLIYFSGFRPPRYHGDAMKSAKACHPIHPDWSTLGDIGYVDEDGFLYLTDRKAFTIISGGVNIYPQEAENVLLSHPKIADVAVIGVPHDDFGEEVKAVVEVMPGVTPDKALAEEFLQYCAQHLSKIKCPKSVDFVDELPRHATGKLYKQAVRDRYWPP